MPYVLAMGILIFWTITPLIGEVLSQWDTSRCRPVVWPTADRALLELKTINAMNCREMLGPYSRFGWNHPGPLFFYALVPFYCWFGNNGSSLALGTAVLHLGLVIFLIWVTLARVKQYSVPLAISILLVSGLYFRCIHLSSYWNPHVLAIPFLVILVLSPLIWCGALWAVLTVVLLGSFIVQTHVGTLPCTLAALVGGIAYAIVHNRCYQGGLFTKKSIAQWSLLVAVVTATCWIMPLLEQASGEVGNFAKLAAFFSCTDEKHSFGAAMETISEEVAWMRLNRGPRFHDFETIAPIIAGTQIMCVLVHGLYAAFCSRRGYETAISFVALLVFATAIWSISRIRGPIHPFLVNWMSSIGVILYAIPLSAIIARILPAKCWVGTACAVLAVYSAAETYSHLSPIWKDRCTSVECGGNVQVRRAVALLMDSLRDAGIKKPVVNWDHPSWQLAAGIVLQLAKHQTPFSVASQWTFMTGPLYAKRGGEDGFVIISMKAPDAPLRAGAVHPLPLPDGYTRDYHNRTAFLVVGSYLPLPLTLNFSTRSNLICGILQAGGWGSGEIWGTWTVGKQACLEFPLQHPIGADLILSATTVAFLTEARSEITVDILANGTAIGKWIFLHGEPEVDREVRIDETVADQRNPLEILFRISDPASPSSLGLSNDTRLLGMGVKTLRLEKAPTKCGRDYRGAH
ncbi:MAG: hypothetical protein AB1733_10985 [Thermodesulfobacteriota bacterium]